MQRLASRGVVPVAFFSLLAFGSGCSAGDAGPLAQEREARVASTAEAIDTPNPDVLTNRYDNGRTSHLVVPGMTGPSVQSGHWDKRGTLPVDGTIFAQPLFTQRMLVADGALHDVVYVATSRNKVYAYDANTYAKLWERDFAGPDRIDETLTVKDANGNTVLSGCAAMSPTWVDTASNARNVGMGIQSTPVIDRNANMLYVSYRTRVGATVAVAGGGFTGGSPEQHVAAIRLSDGAVMKDQALDFGRKDANSTEGSWPYALEGTRQRASLLLSNGVIYVGFASHCEERAGLDYAGRILAVDAATLRTVGAFNVVDPSTGIVGGGIWQASSGIAADPNGDLYFGTGNRQAHAEFTSSSTDVVNSLVRLHPVPLWSSTGALQEVIFIGKDGGTGAWDWFSPYRSFWHNYVDLDLGSAGVVLPPNTNAILGGGKEGVLYALDRDHMGGIDANAWTDSEMANLDAGGCFLPAEANGWCSDFPATLRPTCAMAPDDPAHDQRPGSQKLQVGTNFECLVLGTPPRAANWGQYPHLHNTPAYARLTDGREFMYLWPEKDHLKAYQRDSSSSTFRFLPTPIDAPALAPARGMPGGFITVATDSQSAGGVVFAAVPQTPNQDSLGTLVAYDAVPNRDGTLHQVWSAYNTDNFRFAKFVPPTIADGKVFLATFSNAVEVYGPGAGPDLQMAQANIGAILQNPATNQVTAAVALLSGQIAVFGEKNNGGWGAQQTLGTAGQYPAGGSVALDVQNSTQLDVLAVGNDGALHVSWLQLAADPNGAWATAAVTGGGLYPPGTKVVTAHQGAAQLDVFLVGNDGHLHEVSVSGWGNWKDAAIAPSGDTGPFAHGNCMQGGCASLAVGFQGPGAQPNNQQLDVIAVDHSGVLWVYATPAAAGSSGWNRYDILNGQQLFPPNADLTTSRQSWQNGNTVVDDQLDVFGVNDAGNVEVVWVYDYGQWGQYAMTGTNFITPGALPGSHVTAGHQGTQQVDVAVVGTDGTIQLYYAEGEGAWKGFETGTIGISTPGAPITMVPQASNGTQLDILVPRPNGIFGIYTGVQGWLGPFRAL
ncbi:MAG TPA: hypothetical protein VGI39_40015 [Polyangiaceae bacterium]|jgi:hypothetical protein